MQRKQGGLDGTNGAPGTFPNGPHRGVVQRAAEGRFRVIHRSL